MKISNAFKERRKCGELQSAVFLLGSGEWAHIFSWCHYSVQDQSAKPSKS